MKRFALVCFAMMSLTSVAQTSESAIKVEWFQPEKYTDVRPVNESKAMYRKHVLESFDKFWLKLGERLPAGYKLVLLVKDVDLAGDVNPLYQVDNRDIRVIKDIYFPKITLDYQLKDANGAVIAAEQDVKIKDMNFMSSVGLRFSSQEFGHEKSMLEKWFLKTILAKTPAAAQ